MKKCGKMWPNQKNNFPIFLYLQTNVRHNSKEAIKPGNHNDIKVN